jgi:hypothetical protein
VIYDTPARYREHSASLNPRGPQLVAADDGLAG